MLRSTFYSLTLLTGICFAESHFPSFTTTDTDLPDVKGIVSTKIVARFPRRGVKGICLGTVIHRLPRVQDCEYTLLTAAHCLTRMQNGVEGRLEESEIADRVEIERLRITSTTMQIHPFWWPNKLREVQTFNGADIAYVKFTGKCTSKALSPIKMKEQAIQGTQELYVASLNMRKLLKTKIEFNDEALNNAIILPKEGEVNRLTFGDSGGGCFIKEKGEFVLIGVHSFKDRKGASYCTAPKKLAWVKETAFPQ